MKKLTSTNPENCANLNNPPETQLQSSDNSHSNKMTNSSEEISLNEIIRVLWWGKYIVIACAIICISLGVTYALLSPEIFTTSSLFITKTGKNSTGGNLSQLASIAGISFPTSGNMDPSDYLDKVIQDQSFLSTLFEKKWLYKGDSLPLETILEIKPDTTAPNWAYRFYMSKIEGIRNNRLITIDKEIKSNILTLTVNMPDPHLSYDINKYTLDYISNYIRNSLQSQAKEKRIFIEDRINETKIELEKSEILLVKFRERNITSQSPTVMLEESRLARQVALNQEIYLQFQKQYELVKIEELDDQALVQVVKSPEIPVKRSKPKKKQIVFLSLLFGILLGIATNFLHQFIIIPFRKGRT